jgi:mycobactin phenyloxazoline synthetase
MDMDPLDFDTLRASVAEVLDTAAEGIGDDDNLVALGLDSVKMMALSARLRRYGVRLRFASMVREPTLRAWWQLAAPAPGVSAT